MGDLHARAPIHSPACAVGARHGHGLPINGIDRQAGSPRNPENFRKERASLWSPPGRGGEGLLR
jgi:hypothetical protein